MGWTSARPGRTPSCSAHDAIGNLRQTGCQQQRYEGEKIMDSVDLEVLRNSARWLERGHRVLLVTVVKTWGSSPRPQGAMLAVRDDGHVMGSVSGGCIEDDLIDRVRRHGIERTLPEAVKYGISAEEAHRFGLPCGGTIELVLEPLSQSSGIAELCSQVGEGRLVART